MPGTEAANVIADAKEPKSPAPRGTTFETVVLGASPPMNERLPGSTATKRDVAMEIFPLIARQLARAGTSRYSADEGEQGLSTFAFSTQACEPGHLTPDNWEDRFARIRREDGYRIMHDAAEFTQALKGVGGQADLPGASGQEPVLIFGHHPLHGQGWILTCNLEGEISLDDLFIPGDLGDAGRVIHQASELLHGSDHSTQDRPQHAEHEGMGRA